jgi:vacuolar-type H+-ATPase subunit E/Vma4
MARCTAHSSRTGLPCKRNAIRGGTVCRSHGGAAPQVKAKAAERIEQLLDRFFDRLSESLGGMTTEQIEALKSDAHQIKALTDSVVKLSEHREVLEGRTAKRSEVTVNEQSDFDREIAALVEQLAAQPEAPALCPSENGSMAPVGKRGAATS